MTVSVALVGSFASEDVEGAELGLETGEAEG